MTELNSGEAPGSVIGQFGDETLKTPEMVQGSEAQVWSETLGTTIEALPLPDSITPEVIKKMNDLDLDLRYVPALLPDGIGQYTSSDKERRENQIRLRDMVLQRYPGISPDLLEIADEGDRVKPSRGRSHRDLRFESIWDSVAKNQPHWVAIERTNRPVFDPKASEVSPYDRTTIGDIIAYDDLREVGFEEINDRFKKGGKKLLDVVFGEDFGAEMQLLTAPEWMTLALREGWYKKKGARTEWLNSTEERERQSLMNGPMFHRKDTYAAVVGNILESLPEEEDESMIIDMNAGGLECGYRIAIGFPQIGSSLPLKEE